MRKSEREIICSRTGKEREREGGRAGRRKRKTKDRERCRGEMGGRGAERVKQRESEKERNRREKGWGEDREREKEVWGGSRTGGGVGGREGETGGKGKSAWARGEGTKRMPRMEEIKLKLLRLPKFPTSFQGSPRTYIKQVITGFPNISNKFSRE